MPYPHPDNRLFLGSQVQADGKVLFRLWAPVAQAVELLFWSESCLAKSAVIHQATCRLEQEFGTWFFEFRPADFELILPFYYQYNVEANGKILAVLDPWAVACDIYTGGPPPRACVLPPIAWQADVVPVADGAWYHHASQAVIYEAHVRDLTIAPDSPLPSKSRGTYIGAIAALDHIKALGVTHLQLLPLQLFGRTNETKREYEASDNPYSQNYNWGYDPISYFIPSAWYARDPSDPFSRIRDLRLLVQEAHTRGLRVTLDVVYNHLHSTEILEHLAPGYWFRMNDDGSFCSNSGCGNDLESTRPLFRRLLIDSLVHLIRQFDLDGFRFDLMGMIDQESMLEAWKVCHSLKSDVLFIGEGWKMYNGPSGSFGMDQTAVAQEQNLAVFNDEYRDLMKGGGMNEELLGFLHGHKVGLQILAANILGKPRKRYRALHPWNNVNYLECHDGLTLHDNLSFNLRLFPGDRVVEQEILRRCALGNFILALSQGLCFLHAGQEIGRSKKWLKGNNSLESLGEFVRNSYNAGDGVNAISWAPSENQQWLRAWTAGAINLRMNHTMFQPAGPGHDERIFHFWNQGPAAVLVWTIERGETISLCAVNATKNNHLVRLSSAQLSRFGMAQAHGTLRCLADRTDCTMAGIDKPVGFVLDDETLKIEALSALILLIEN